MYIYWISTHQKAIASRDRINFSENKLLMKNEAEITVFSKKCSSNIVENFEFLITRVLTRL